MFLVKTWFTGCAGHPIHTHWAVVALSRNLSLMPVDFQKHGLPKKTFFVTAESSACCFGSRRLCFVVLRLLTDRLTVPRLGLDMRLVCYLSSAGT